jgi:hypothetical protein
LFVSPAGNWKVDADKCSATTIPEPSEAVAARPNHFRLETKRSFSSVIVSFSFFEMSIAHSEQKEITSVMAPRQPFFMSGASVGRDAACCVSTCIREKFL